MNSIISYPQRGHYGNQQYRGNTSGYVIKDLIDHFKPRLFVDTCEGSGTSREVCKEMNIEYVGLDLHHGFDFCRDSIANHIPRLADICFSHPPYFDMISYKKEREKHGFQATGDDLSDSVSLEEFLEKSQLMLHNQRLATRAGGIYSSLIGDYRKEGKFYSLQADYISMMPREELLSVVIKTQHNHKSGFKSYQGKFIPIVHEYLLIWKKSSQTLVQVACNRVKAIKDQISATWRTVVRLALMQLDGTAALKDIYEEVCKLASQKVKANKHYKAKIRQTLQYYFNQVEKGKWAL
jgi:hypothetical protein